MNELGQIAEELKNEPESLRKSILSTWAKLKGLDLLTATNAFQRDQSRLNARQRAVYKSLKMPEQGDEETITNTLADNITYNAPSKGVSPWVTVALSTLAGGLIGGGVAALYPVPQGETPPVVVDPPPVIVPAEPLRYQLDLLPPDPVE